MTAQLQCYASNPATQLETVFRDIERTRMAGLPILNPALAVEAVDFSIWQGHWLGVLITPWFMNVMLLPGVQADWQSVADGKWAVWQLPAGERRFYSIVSPPWARCMPIPVLAGIAFQRSGLGARRGAALPAVSCSTRHRTSVPRDAMTPDGAHSSPSVSGRPRGSL